MQKKLRSLLFLLTIGITITTLLQCVLPTDPNAPKNTSIEVLLKSSQGIQNSTSIEDSVGKELMIGAVCFLPANLTTFSVKVTSLDKQLLLDTTIYSFLTDSTYDTILLPIIFTKPGAMNIAIEAVTSFGKVLREEAIVIIHNRELKINHAPVITTSGKINLQPSNTCSLTVEMSDVDSGQYLTMLTSKKPTGSIVKGDSLFVWQIPSGYIGRDTVIFIVTDNGIPAMTDSDTVIITVTSTPLNNPPKWKHPKLKFTVETGTTFLLPLRDSISDPDRDSIAFRLVSLDPVGDTIIASSYQFTPKGNTSGDFTIKIAGTDNNGGWDTLSIALSVIESVTDTDNIKPDFKMIDGPASGSTVNSSTFTLLYEIKDSSGIDSVWWSLNGTIKGLATAESGGNYTFTGTLPTTSHSNTIIIEAKDKSSLHNHESVEIILNYNTPPSEINATAPVNSGTGIATQTVFSWTGGDDNDGDTVYYRVIYGTSETNLIRQTPVTTGKTVTIPSGDELDAFTKYYWQVVGYTKTYADTVRSNIRSFTTAGVEPVVTKSPESATINEGDPLTLSVTATGIPSPTFQWFKDGNPIANETNTTFSKAAVLGADSGIYYVKVNNGVGNGVQSDTASVSVRLKPVITGQPEAATVTVGDSVTFAIVATGTAPLTYQWQRNQSNISGATSTTLKIQTAVANNGDKYRCVVANAAGTATSNEGLLTVNYSVPTISVQPISQNIDLGGEVTFSVTASGIPAPTYQWKKNGTAITGATSSTLKINEVWLPDSGDYGVDVSNSVQTTTSTTATLKLIYPVQVAAGGNYSIVLKNDGYIYVCGINEKGQFGDGTKDSRSTFTRVNTLSEIKSVSAGQEHTMIFKNDGTLWTFGDNTYGQYGNGTKVWQQNPVQAPHSNIKSIASQNANNVIYKSDGTIWYCGYNRSGNFGDGSEEDKTSFTRVLYSDVKEIVSGNWHNLILKTDNTVMACGWNNSGQLGDGTNDDTKYMKPVGINGVISIAANHYNSYFVKSDNTLWVCGESWHGQIGDNSNSSSPARLTLTKSLIENVAAVYAQNLFFVALKTDNSLWGSGDNSSGQLGNGTKNDVYIPIQIAENVKMVALGNSHTLMLKNDMTVWACGTNFNGELGNGSGEMNHLTLVRVIPPMR